MKINNKTIDMMCNKAKGASRLLALMGTQAKNRALSAMACELMARSSYILKENARDVSCARKKKTSCAMIDRLILNKSRIEAMSRSMKEIASLKDPVGEILSSVKRPNGLLIKKVRVPIGVILMIYESRPNVTSDCVGLCLKSGNSAILRGGSEAIRSNTAIFKALDAAASRSDMPDGAITMIEDIDRSVIGRLLEKNDLIDLVMPRGGESLIKYVTSRSRIPVIKHYKGVCHVYVDKSADLKMAEDICFNAKVQRPGVCNAMETMLVHKDVAGSFLPSMTRRFVDSGVELRGSKIARSIAQGMLPVSEEDWYSEYLDLILSVGVVKDIDEAISHIMKYGSYHSDTIVTNDRKAQERFTAGVDSACVYVNASTRFTDGGQFGKGAEIGISTDKIHARGPMGLEELTSYKYIVYGNGQIRE